MKTQLTHQQEPRFLIEFETIPQLEAKIKNIKMYFRLRAKKNADKLDKLGIKYVLYSEEGTFLIRGDSIMKEQEKQVKAIFRPMRTKRFNKKFGITEIV